MSDIAYALIATGDKYRSYLDPLLHSARRFFLPHDTFVWTDTPVCCGVHKQFYQADRGYPGATLYRYHTFLSQRSELEKYKYIFYSDVDMLWVDRAEPEILSEGITATRHAGYMVREKYGSPELRRASAAYLPHPRAYYAGGFVGGTTEAFLTMAEMIAAGVDNDRRRGITAVWHDESHMNRYLFDSPPARELSPSYCYPEGYGGGYGWAPDENPPKLIALEKGAR